MAILAAAVVLGCGDSFTASTSSVAGNYTLQSFTTTDSTGTTNWVTAGATLTIALAANGTTTGHLFVPGGDVGGGDLNADMAGTWTLVGDIVTFSQAADTFVRNVPFVATANRLTGDQQFTSTRVRIALTK
jgi:hypothetical protein